MDEYKRKGKHVYVALIWAGGALLMLVCLVLLYWMLFPQPKTSYAEGSYNVVPETVVAGGAVEVTGPKYCNEGVEVTVERGISNDFGELSLPSLRFYAPHRPICIDPNVFVVNIPAETPPGEWYITFTSTYQANPVQSISTTRATDKFTVTAPS